MTKEEKDFYCVEKFNKMLSTLRNIAESYLTPDQLREIADTGYGMEYDEALENAYKNIQLEAAACIKSIIKARI